MKRHPFDVLSFVAGAVFVLLGIGFATAGSDVVDQARWVWPAILLTLGAAGLSSVLRSPTDGDD
jgi:hypothetical protein